MTFSWCEPLRHFMLISLYITVFFSADPRPKCTSGRKEAHTDLPLCTGAHQRRTAAFVCETDNVFQGMKWKPSERFLPILYHNVFSIKR